ncbi:MAG: hypothetical protein ACP5VP_11050 [Candidatus Limnocylindrales bacterium]
MPETLSSLIRPEPGPVLPAFERLAPPPPLNVVAAEIEARSRPGDVVVDLFGRGGWVARTAIAHLRRSYTFESAPLTRLLAEVVLRPPDIRHFDAAVQSLAAHPRGDGTLRLSIAEQFASRCPTCGRSVTVDEFIWDGEADAPSRKSYRCITCRDQLGGSEQRSAPTDAADAARSQALREELGDREALRSRYAVVPGLEELPDQLLSLYTPRTLAAFHGIIERLDADLRAASVEAALRLALLQIVLPASKLNSYPGRVAALRIANGRVRMPGGHQWRERNPWLLFEDGCRLVRGFIQRVSALPGGQIQARLGDDLLDLADATANVVVRRGLPPVHEHGGVRARAERPDPRVRLVLTQPPPKLAGDTLAFAYHATCLVLGPEAGATLPLEGLLGPTQRPGWGWEASALERGLGAVRPILAPDARAVVILEPGGPEGLVAGALGGVGAGYRLTNALLAEAGDLVGGTLEFGLSGESALRAESGGGVRALAGLRAAEVGDEAAGDRAGRSAREGSGDSARDWASSSAGDRVGNSAREGSAVASAGGYALADDAEGNRSDRAPGFQLSAVREDVAATAVAILQARGEPARFERLLGEILVGLDRAGHLRRLVGTRTYGESVARAEYAAAALGLMGERPSGEAVTARPEVPLPGVLRLEAPRSEAPHEPGSPEPAHEAVARSDAERESAHEAAREPAHEGPAHKEPAHEAAREPAHEGPAHEGPAHEAAVSVPPAVSRGADHVTMLLDLIQSELTRAAHPRLVEVEPGRWWLRNPRDLQGAALPLSDRLEWAIFSLLSTTGGLSEAAFYDRIAAMFQGYDAPDEPLVRACLESYRSRASTPELLTTGDELQARYREHTDLVGLLVEYGHRLGLRCWVGAKEQKRPYRGRPLAELLSDQEARAYLPLVSRGPVEALESVDCMWYQRGKATLIFEVEWTAMLGEPVLRRGRLIPQDDSVVRFLVILPERAELVRFKLARSPVLRAALDEGNWYLIKANHLRTLIAREGADLERFAPYLGLDPEIERQGQQLPLFE